MATRHTALRPNMRLRARKWRSRLAVKTRGHVQAAPNAVPVIADSDALPLAQRLVVLIPEVVCTDTELARRIWLLASPRGLPVLYLGLVDDDRLEMEAKRHLATLASLTQDRRTRVDSLVLFERNGLRALQQTLRPGDLMICTATPPDDATALASTVGAPVYRISGPSLHPPGDPPRRSRQILLDASAVLIIVGFFVLQLHITQLSRDWAYYLLMSLSVIAEGGSIWLWSRLLD